MEDNETEVNDTPKITLEDLNQLKTLDENLKDTNVINILRKKGFKEDDFSLFYLEQIKNNCFLRKRDKYTISQILFEKKDAVFIFIEKAELKNEDLYEKTGNDYRVIDCEIFKKKYMDTGSETEIMTKEAKDEIEKIKNENTQLRSLIDVLNTELTQSIQNIEETVSKNSENLKLIEELKNVKTKLQEALEKIENFGLEKEDLREKRNRNLESLETELKKANTATQEALEALETANKTASDKAAADKAAAEDAAAEDAAAAKTIHDTEIAGLLAKIAKLQEELAAAKQTEQKTAEDATLKAATNDQHAIELQNQIRVLEQQLADAVSAAAAAETRYNTEIAGLKNEIAELKQQLEKAKQTEKKTAEDATDKAATDEQHVVELQSRIEALEQELAAAKVAAAAANTQYDTEIKRLQAEIAKLKQQLEEANKTAADATVQAATDDQRAAKLESEIATLKQQLAAAVTAAEEANTKITILESENQKLKEQLETLQKKLKTLQTQLEEAIVENQTYNDTIYEYQQNEENLKEEIKILKEQIKNVTTEKDNAEQTIVKLEEELRVANAATEDANRTSLETINKLNNQIQTLEQELRVAKAATEEVNRTSLETINELNNQIQNLEKRIQKLEENLRNATKATDEATEKASVDNEAANLLRERIKQLENDLEAINNENYNLTQNLSTANENIKKLEDEKNILTEQLNEAKRKTEASQTENTDLKDTITRLTAQLAKLNTDLASMTSERDELIEQVNKLNLEKQDLEQKILTLNRELKDLNSNYNNTSRRLEAQIQVLEQKNNGLTKENRTLTNNLNALQTQHDFIKTNNDQLNKQIQDKEAENTNRKQQSDAEIQAVNNLIGGFDNKTISNFFSDNIEKGIGFLSRFEEIKSGKEVNKTDFKNFISSLTTDIEEYRTSIHTNIHIVSNIVDTINTYDYTNSNDYKKIISTIVGTFIKKEVNDSETNIIKIANGYNKIISKLNEIISRMIDDNAALASATGIDQIDKLKEKIKTIKTEVNDKLIEVEKLAGLFTDVKRKAEVQGEPAYRYINGYNDFLLKIIKASYTGNADGLVTNITRAYNTVYTQDNRTLTPENYINSVKVFNEIKIKEMKKEIADATKGLTDRNYTYIIKPAYNKGGTTEEEIKKNQEEIKKNQEEIKKNQEEIKKNQEENILKYKDQIDLTKYPDKINELLDMRGINKKKRDDSIKENASYFNGDNYDYRFLDTMYSSPDHKEKAINKLQLIADSQERQYIIEYITRPETERTEQEDSVIKDKIIKELKKFDQEIYNEGKVFSQQEARDKATELFNIKEANSRLDPVAAAKREAAKVKKKAAKGGEFRNKTRRHKQPVNKTGLVKKRKTIRFRDNKTV